MVDRIQHTVKVHASAKKCYEVWHQFENFPRFMNHVKKVSPVGDNRWRWIITTPLGRDVEWTAHIDSDERNRLMSWHTVDENGHPNLKVNGTVRFDETAPNRTEVTCTIHFEIPGSPIREAIAELLVHPQAMLEEEMLHFKHRVEGTDRPAEKVAIGKTLTEPQGAPVRGYAGPFDLEDVLSEEGIDLDEIEDPAIRDLLFEENPYLGVEGAREDEDAWPESNEVRPVVQDAFSESLDVFDEDLENFTEDLDDNIDSAFVTGQSVEEYEMLQEAEQIKPSQAKEPTQSEL
ncbi:MAG TPA: SRPBCC family protein [Oculatellaceae cyanobacterium]